MPIPANDLFESFMSATKLVRIKPDGPFVQFTGGPVSENQAALLYLSYPEIEIKLESVIMRIASELSDTGFSSDNGIALAVLGILAETWDRKICPFVTHANHVLSLAQTAQYFHSVVLPNRPSPGYEIKIGEFLLKAFDAEKLLYWARRGRSGYPIDLDKFKGCIALEQEPIDTKLIDWDEVPGCNLMIKKWGGGVTFASIMDVYYQAVAWHHSQQIPKLVKERLMVLEGGGLVSFDIQGLLSSVMAQHIGQFRWVGTGGHRSWALLSQLSVFYVNFYPPKLFIDCENWLYKELGFKGLSKDKPLDSTIASYCRFLQRAQTLRIDCMSDEALLHFVIALDLLLGLEGRSSESVGLRASVLVYRQLGRTFDNQFGQIKKIYDRRSKYVHEGRPVSPSDLEEAEKVCTQILWALLATSASESFNDIGGWLRQIDFLTSAIKASKLLPDSEFTSVGIPAAGCTRIPPNRVVQSRLSG